MWVVEYIWLWSYQNHNTVQNVSKHKHLQTCECIDLQKIKSSILSSQDSDMNACVNADCYVQANDKADCLAGRAARRDLYSEACLWQVTTATEYIHRNHDFCVEYLNCNIALNLLTQP